jgi:hypothetical protein
VEVEQLLGQVLSRDIAPGAQVDGELDAFIERRHKERVKAEGERRLEAEWKASERKHNAARDAELRTAWSEYHKEQAERHKAVLASLIEHHEAEASKLGGAAACYSERRG